MRKKSSKPKYYHKYIGVNFRLDPIQEAALLVKRPHLSDWSKARRKNAKYYNKKFADTAVQIPYVSDDCISIYNQYVIRIPKRDKLITHMRQNNIGCEIYYPVPLHLQECFKSLGYKQGDFPEAEKAAQEVLALPIYPELTDQMKNFVTDTVLAVSA